MQKIYSNLRLYVKKIFHSRKRLYFIGLVISIILVFLKSGTDALPHTKVGIFPEDVFFILQSKQISSANHTAETSFKPLETFISEEKTADFAFDAVSMSWNEEIPMGTNINFLIRFFVDRKWTSWLYVNKDIDELEEDSSGKQHALMLTNKASKFQYRVQLITNNPETTPTFKDLEFRYYNSSSDFQLSSVFNARTLLSSLKIVSSSKQKIISRTKWGADESLRIRKQSLTQEITENEFEKDLSEETKTGSDTVLQEIAIVKTVTNTPDGEELLWPLEYPDKVNRIIIHHTATSTTGELADSKAALRSIYFYHAVTRGWGDIGYNYIIDTKGNVYQGRYGDEGVVGGHAGAANKGSIGIAIVGNYQEKDPLPEVIQSLLNLIVEKSRLHKIRPDGFAKFKDQLIPNIIGHRDVMDTSCPGHKVYEMLPYIRLLATRALYIGKFEKEDAYAFEEVSDRSMTIMQPETAAEITIQLKNTGTETWTQKMYLIHDDNELRKKLVSFSRPSLEQANRIAYLKEESVKPGDKGLFTFSISSQLASGLTSYHLYPVFEGKEKSKNSLILPIMVEQPQLAFALYQTALPHKKAKIGQVFKEGWFKLQNMSSISWTKDGIKSVCLQAQSTEECVGILVEDEVKPRDIGHFQINYVPRKTGHIDEKLMLVMSELGVIEGTDLKYEIDVEGNTYLAEMMRQNTDNIFGLGETKSGWIEVKNTGDLPWSNSSKKKLRIFPLGSESFSAMNFKVPEGKIDVRETARIDFDITAPSDPGGYEVYFWPRLGSKSLSKSPFRYRLFVTKDPEKYNLAKSRDLDIRILLSFRGNPIISADGLFKLYTGDDFDRNIKKTDQVEVAYEQGKYRLKIGREAVVSSEPPRFVPGIGTIMQIVNYDNPSKWDPSIVYNRYRGILEVYYDDDQLTVINQLPLEEYLRGLAEAPNDRELMEKAKAITVAARTYGLFYMDSKNRKFPGKPYDGNDNPAVFQYYLGYEFERRAPIIIRAVEDTQGEVVTYKGKIVKTPYFSSSDGRTRSAEEVFGWTNTPYLVSVSDPYCEGMKLRGHGVGMSGCGAEGAARAGKQYVEILKYYYQGIKVMKKY